MLNKLPGGKGDKLNPKYVDQNELKMGIKHEMEHTKSASIAQEIALDHLAENPKYYSDLNQSGIDEIERMQKLAGIQANELGINNPNKIEGDWVPFDNSSEDYTLGKLIINNIEYLGALPKRNTNFYMKLGNIYLEFSNIEDIDPNHAEEVEYYNNNKENEKILKDLLTKKKIKYKNEDETHISFPLKNININD